MLRRGDDLRALGIGALQAADEGDAHRRGQDGILAIGFLAASPARIAEDVDVGGPAVEPGSDMPDPPGFARERVEPADLGADRACYRLDERRIEAGGQTDRLGEIGRRDRPQRAVERFRPPVIGRNVEPRDCGRDVEQLGQLLVRAKLRDERGGHDRGLVGRVRAGLRSDRGRDEHHRKRERRADCRAPGGHHSLAHHRLPHARRTSPPARHDSGVSNGPTGSPASSTRLIAGASDQA